MGYWRRTASFGRHAYTANVVIMTAGFVLIGYPAHRLLPSDPDLTEPPCTTPNSDPRRAAHLGSAPRSTVLAIAVAAVLLVTVVLPAEYGIDPTGIGRA